MFLHESLIGQRVIKRKGVIEEILLPKEKLLSSDIIILLGSQQIEFRDGESIFVIDKEIGIKEELHTTIFIAGPYLICEILKGNIYIKNKDNLYCITDTGTKRKSKVLDKELKWLNVQSYIDLVLPLISSRYNIYNNNSLARQYLDNISLDLVLKNEVSYEDINGVPEEFYMFSLKIIEEYRNFGLDKFEFKVFEKPEVKETRYDGMDSYTLWQKERERERKEKAAIRKAEQIYLSLKEGEEIEDYGEDEKYYHKFKKRNQHILDNFTEFDDFEEDVEEEIEQDDY